MDVDAIKCSRVGNIIGRFGPLLMTLLRRFHNPPDSRSGGDGQRCRSRPTEPYMYM